jgi:hypothetical protein
MAMDLSLSLNTGSSKLETKSNKNNGEFAKENINQLLTVIANIRRSFLVEQPQLLPVVAQSLIDAENIVFNMSNSY